MTAKFPGPEFIGYEFDPYHLVDRTENLRASGKNLVQAFVNRSLCFRVAVYNALGVVNQGNGIAVPKVEFLPRHLPQFAVLAERAGVDEWSQFSSAFTGFVFDIAKLCLEGLFPISHPIHPNQTNIIQ
jgi:hypothetical protein